MQRPVSSTRRAVRAVNAIVLGRLPIGRWLRKIPFLEKWFNSWVMARTDRAGHLFSGLYPSYKEAMADIPASRATGWDHDETAKLWQDEIDPVRPSSYPVFFWLSCLLREDTTLIDLGGSIGLTYYALRRYLNLPNGATWTVIEVPAIADEGARIAARENATNLRFVSQIADAPAADILLSAGAMHFMEESIPGLLERLPKKPRFILLNKLPVADYENTWTLHNYGPALTPNRVFNDREFIGYFESHGYRLKDRWAMEDLYLLIPFHPEKYLRAFSGFLFELAPD
jgi:putative methyltransferase (TIGR04325 family)